MTSGPVPTWLYRYADGDVAVLDTVDRALRTFHGTCLTPRWSSVTTRFHHHVDRHVRVLGEHGLAEMLNTLSPDLHLNGHTPTARNPGQREVHLRGTGLILMPSQFWTGHPLITWDPQDQSRHVLIYSARTAPPVVAAPGTRAGDALAALTGTARAAVLRALCVPHTTSELAARVGISVSSASQHATTLREAGLITSHRRGQAVQHRLTHLGTMLLQQQ